METAAEMKYYPLEVTLRACADNPDSMPYCQFSLASCAFSQAEERGGLFWSQERPSWSRIASSEPTSTEDPDVAGRVTQDDAMEVGVSSASRRPGGGANGPGRSPQGGRTTAGEVPPGSQQGGG